MAGASKYRKALRVYGYHLGMAFQMVDDLLDYLSPTELTGKPRGQDLQEHKVTLPLIAALPILRSSERRTIQELFNNPTPTVEDVSAVIDLVSNSGGIDVARKEARRHAELARECIAEIPETEYLVSLQMAADYVVERVR